MHDAHEPTCRNHDFDLFLSLWNANQKQATPKLHFAIATWLQRSREAGKNRLLLQAFRGSGKSTLTALFSAWLLYRRPDCRILVLSAESHTATKMSRNIRKIVETHPLTGGLLSRAKTKTGTKTAGTGKPSPDPWGADCFTVARARESRDPSVLARGLTSNITGARADIIICDDVEVPNSCATAAARKALRERLTEASFILTPGGTMLYLGTPHCWHTIYADAPREELGENEVFLKDYERLSVPVVDGGGRPAWPERFDAAHIDTLRRTVGPASFATQMMLEPMNLMESRLDPAGLQFYDTELAPRESNGQFRLSLSGRRLAACSAWWDPAFAGANGRGDGSVLAIVFTDAEGQYYLHDIAWLSGEGAPGEDAASAQCRQVAALAARYFVPAIAVETNGIGKFLPALLRNVLADANVPCAVREQASHRAKDLRILEAFDVPLAARALHVHERVRRTSFLREMADWQPGLTGAKDDGLDAVAGALSLQPVRLRRRYAQGGGKSWGQGRAHTARTDFPL